MDTSALKTPASWITAYTGKPLDGFINNLKSTKDYQDHVKKVNAPPTTVGVNKQTVLDYVNKKLT
jgi:hypothetical protein